MYPDAPEVELLDTRPPRPGRRWRQALVGLVVLAAVGALVVARSGDDGSPGPSQPSSPPPVVTTAPAPSASTIPGVITSPDVAFTRIGNTVYAVDNGVLITVDLQTGLRRTWPPVPEGDRYALLADPSGRTVWLVAATDTRTVVESLNASTLEVGGQARFPSPYLDAAGLGGFLYVGTAAGVSVVGTGGGSIRYPAPALGGKPLALAADPTRNRVLVTVIKKGPIAIGAWPAFERRPETLTRSPVGKGDLVAAGGRIWAAGFGQHAVLVRLDPRTLRVVRHSPLEGELGNGGVIVDAGTRHLLVRPGETASDLWCIDAGSGAVVRHWGGAAGAAALTARGVVLLAPGAPLELLRSGACRG